jgi:[ribosomal protein S5]-alanine N-acetyltransferase
MEGLILDPATRLERIETTRLVLRRATLDDLDAIHAAMRDPGVMRYWSTLPHKDVEQTRLWLTAMAEADPATSDEFVIELGGVAIGKLGAFCLPEVGFLLHPDYHGKGYGGEALVAFTSYIRGRGLPGLTADVDPRNAASLALLKGAGFVETGRAERSWLVGDQWCDSIYLGLEF